MTLLTEFKDKTASFARLLTAAMTSMLLLGILAPSGSGGTNDGVLNFSNNAFTPAAAYHHYIRCSGCGYRPGPGHDHVRHQPGRDDLGTLRRRGRCDSRYSAQSGRHNHLVRRSGRRDRPPAGHSALQHQPGRHERGLLLRREQCVSWFPAHSGRCDHYLERPGCGHRSRPGYLRRQHQSAGGDRGTLR